jgi:tRNA threonylcarbamoyladenosine biosynthesis protein TsaB
MGEVYWAEYVRDEAGVWQGESSEAVLKPDAVAERLAGLTGEWTTVGTGWLAWPDMAQNSGLQIRDGETTLPEAEDMLPLALAAFNAGRAVAVEESEPVYLRNEVTWKKLPGRE